MVEEQGWYGDSLGHRKAALKGQAREANNTPMTKQPTDAELTISFDSLMATPALNVNLKQKTDEELVALKTKVKYGSHIKAIESELESRGYFKKIRQQELRVKYQDLSWEKLEKLLSYMKTDPTTYADEIEVIQEILQKSQPQKEPWQMAKDEFIEDYYKKDKNNRTIWKGKDFTEATAKIEAHKLGSEWKIEASPHEKGRFIVVKETAKTPINEYKKEYGNDLEVVHKQMVKKAVSEGKPVPLEVLKDYPDIGRQEA